MGKAYRGFREVRVAHDGVEMDGECHVWVFDFDGKTQPLDPHLELVNHSPTGMEWGYPGSGPAQLAFALAFDATGDRLRSELVHQELKRRLVCRFPHREWTITAAEVLAAIGAIEDEELVGQLGDLGGDQEED